MAKKQVPLPLLLEHAPNTAMILGAALSGGDALKIAKMLCQSEPDTTEQAENEQEDEDDES